MRARAPRPTHIVLRCAFVLQYNLVGVMDEEKIRLREEVNEQIRALAELKGMAGRYGFDISK